MTGIEVAVAGDVSGPVIPQSVRRLQRMLQFETVSRRGDAQTEKFAAFHVLLQELYPAVFSVLQGEHIGTALLMRWPGTDASRPGALLMAHSDVVEASDGWRHPPFAGEIAEGFLWGRGALDNKHCLCGLLEAAEALIAEGFAPACDLYLLTTCNEEIMGEDAALVAETLRARDVRLSLVLDEGGAMVEKPLPGLDGWFAMVGLMEKGSGNLRFTARSTGGHSSTPGRGTPIPRLAAFVNRVERKPPFPCKITEPVRSLFRAAAPHMAMPYRLLFGHLKLFGPLLARVMPLVSNEGNALLRTTVAFTMARGSDGPNVIPQQASVVANLRFHLHQNMERSLAHMRALANRYGLEMELMDGHDCSAAASADDPAYKRVQAVIEASFPGVRVLPYVMLGASDSRHFCELCDCVLRFAPFRMTKELLATVHGVDERIPLEAMPQAADFYARMMREAAKR